MSDSMLADAVEQFLAGQCTPARVRQIEKEEEGAAAALWREVHESGFADTLVPEAHDGAGLSLADACTVAQAAGRHVLPLPLAQTMVLRAALAVAGLAVPEGALTIAVATTVEADGAIVSHAVPFGLTAQWALVTTDRGQLLLPLAAGARSRAGGHGSLDADVRWSQRPADAVDLPVQAGVDWRATGAALTAALMAGAMTRLTEITIAYANDRVQFGKPIGKLQAIQQQLSVMAEQSVAARTAALLALSGAGWQVDALRAAVGKQRAADGAVTVATTAHAVHGAIGVTEEYDLQLLTRRVHEWRAHYGGESYWARRLGEAMVAQPLAPLEFVQQSLAAKHVADA
ncbi:MAG: acyl-CoA dehydrogenase family protein [Burkholderiales bacterium]